jgi:hypothetical protein
MDFLRFSKSHLLFEIQFCEQAPGILIYHEYAPGSQIRPWKEWNLSYGPPWVHYLAGYQDRLLGGPLGLLGLCHTTPDGVGRKDYGGGVLG